MKAYKTYEYIKKKIKENNQLIEIIVKRNIEFQEMLDEIKNTPQEKEQIESLQNRLSVLKNNSEGSNTNCLETQRTMEEVKKHEYKSKCLDNHPVGAYVYLHDVIGLFKNRKQTKTRVNQRRHIIEHLNKLRRVEIK